MIIGRAVTGLDVALIAAGHGDVADLKSAVNSKIWRLAVCPLFLVGSR
jgi:hypothetical protein